MSECYAVIFSSRRKPGLEKEYEAMAERMLALARKQPGFIDVESVRGASGDGMTVSYWESLEAIQAWREHPDHAHAQEEGRGRFYSSFSLKIAKVIRQGSFSAQG